MIPQLTRFDSSEGKASLVPPQRFRPLRGKPTSISFRLGDYTPSQGLTTAQKNGIRYEAQVQEHLLEALGDYYHPSPYIHFADDGGYRTCQPDGVYMLSDRDSIFILEMKYQHMPEAWWQLDQLYAPILRAKYPHNTISCVEICRSYDPATPFPVPITLVENLIEWMSQPRSDFGVFKWRR